METIGIIRGYIGFIQGLYEVYNYWGYFRMMEKKTETTV